MPNKRPYKTIYYSDLGYEHASQGHSASEKGAVRGAVVMVFTQQHRMARIYCDGACLYTVRPSKRGIDVTYGASVMK